VARQARLGWRKDFLKALARTGNAALAARMAGVDKGTAYNLRHRDMGFARAWVRAKRFAQGRVGLDDSPSPQPLSREGRGPQQDLVVRFNRREGAQLVRAGKGRWSEGIRARFREALKATGNVRAAAAAAGISTTALYNRRKRYPLIEAEWAEARESGCRSVSLMLIEAAEAALDPGVDAAALGLPKVSVADAIAILRLHRFEEAGAPSHAGARSAARARARAVEEMPIETVRDEILRRIEAIRAHEARKALEADDPAKATAAAAQGPLHRPGEES
jgi:hypothetical protein